MVDEFNTLNRSNNVTANSRWPVSTRDLGYLCGAGVLATGFIVLQGNYGIDNFTNGSPLGLTILDETMGCPNFPPAPYFNFRPLSSLVNTLPHANDPALVGVRNETLSESSTITGYWTGRTGDYSPAEGRYDLSSPLTFNLFPQGTYTVVAVDEWGKVALLQFAVRNA
jgi:hypothetical protein